MTPQLMQAIKLLQLSNLDLVAYVEGELEKNPLLERADDGEHGAIGTGGASAPSPCADGDRRRRRSGDWIGEDLEVSRSAIEERLGTELDNVFPDDAASRPRRAPGAEQPAAYSEWAGVGSGGREDGDYNLEAFVSAEIDARRSSGRAACARDRRSGAPHDRAVPDRSWSTRPAISPAILASVAEKLGAPLSEVEAVLGPAAGLRSAGRVRAQSHRVPRDPAQGAQPLRSSDAGAARPARPARQARPRRLAAHLRRRRRRPHRNDRGNSQPQPEARPCLRLDRRAADRAGRVRAARPRRQLRRRA